MKHAQRIDLPELASEELISLASSDLRIPKLESRLQSLTDAALNLVSLRADLRALTRIA